MPGILDMSAKPGHQTAETIRAPGVAPDVADELVVGRRADVPSRD
jgi:hypothetical protein